MKLGKLAPKHDPRTLKLADYLDATALPKVPATHSWADRVSQWPIMLNDRLGCCAIAAPGHMIQEWTTYALPKPIVPTDQDILTAYSAVSGYDPRTGANDDGCNMLDVMKYWKNQGIAGHRIDSFASVDPRNTNLVQTSIFLFGAVNIGLDLPASAQSQVGRGPWNVVNGPSARPGSWGGHAVPVVAYGPKGLTCVTWGDLQTMTWQFFETYCDEAFACLDSTDWLVNGKISPSGFDLATLKGDLNLV